MDGQPSRLALLRNGKKVQPYRDRAVHRVSDRHFPEVRWKGWKQVPSPQDRVLDLHEHGTVCLHQNQKDPSVLDCTMKKLDINCDRQLEFQEFLNLIGGMAVVCQDSLTLSQKYV